MDGTHEFTADDLSNLHDDLRDIRMTSSGATDDLRRAGEAN